MALAGAKGWAQSKTIIGCIVTFIFTMSALTGHNLPDDMQSTLTDWLQSGFLFASACGTLYSMWARAHATKTIAPQAILPPVTPKGK